MQPQIKSDRHDDESIEHNTAPYYIQYLHDIRMVRPPQASGNEDFFRLAPHPCNTFLLGCGLLRILRPGAGQQDRLRRQRRPVQSDAAQGNPGSHFPDGIHSHRHTHVQERGPAVESFCRILLPDSGSLLRFPEIVMKLERNW